MGATVTSVFREVTPQRAEEWVARGHKQRHFFPHRAYVLPKCGPDGYRIAEAMTGRDDPAAMREVVLYADPASLAELPPELFFDDDLVWHQQQFGVAGHVGAANLVLDGDDLWVTVLVSDIVQRISRRREHKTRVEKRFKGWAHMLLNAVMAFAVEEGLRRVRTPTASLMLRHTDQSRDPQPPIYERAYDRAVGELYPARRDGEWWEIDAGEAAERVVLPERGSEQRRRGKVVCVFHDVERGLGHTDHDPAFARRAEERAPGDLEAMRRIEAAAGVRTTYCVVGALLPEVRDELAGEGHCLAFHSFDHRLDRDGQLPRCREVDYRLKGYRPPRSQITPELSERNLLFHNFEWLASSASSLGLAAPEMRDGLVRIPIAFDDYSLWKEGVPYEEWEREALARIDAGEFTALGLHDCYAPWWLDRYEGLLGRIGQLGELLTLDEVAASVTLASAA